MRTSVTRSKSSFQLSVKAEEAKLLPIRLLQLQKRLHTSTKSSLISTTVWQSPRKKINPIRRAGSAQILSPSQERWGNLLWIIELATKTSIRSENYLWIEGFLLSPRGKHDLQTCRFSTWIRTICSLASTSVSLIAWSCSPNALYRWLQRCLRCPSLRLRTTITPWSLLKTSDSRQWRSEPTYTDQK